MHYRAVVLLAGLTALATVFYMPLWMDMRRRNHYDLNHVDSDDNLKMQQQHYLPHEYDHSYPHHPQQQQETKPSDVIPQKAPHGLVIHDGLPPKHTKEQKEEEQGQQDDEEPDGIPEDEMEDEDGSDGDLIDNNTTGVGFGDRNARLTTKHVNAYVTFCQQKQPKYLLNGSPLKGVNNGESFASYSDWMGYIRAKNSPGFSKEAFEQQHGDDKGFPAFQERPPAGWVLNLTAIQEPCDRRTHSSAHCLAYLAQNENKYLTRTAKGIEASREKMNVHIFWRGAIIDKVLLSAQAFLFTQPLNRAHLHIWVDSADLPGGLPEDYTKNPNAAPLLQKPFSDYVTIHAWDQEAELRHSYPNAPEFADENTNGNNDKTEPMTAQNDEVKVKPVALSDEARFLILNRNGGVYLDADVLLLRDLSPLYDAGIEFAYEWSHTLMYNTAILRLYAGSTVARRILDGAKAREKQIQQRKAAEHAAALALAIEAEKQQIDVVGGNSQTDGAFGLRRHRQGSPKRLSHVVQAPQDSHEEATNSSLRTKKVLGHKRQLEMGKREVRPEEIYHPARLREYLDPEGRKIEGNGLIMMPVAVFDPLWLRIDNAESSISKDREPMLEELEAFPKAFTDAEAVCPAQMPDAKVPAGEEGEDYEGDEQQKNERFMAGPEVFLPGAYAYHWHNSWTLPIAPDSWMGRMQEAYVDFAAGRRPNLYGEWIKDL
ncbi:hypothetical protein BGW42_003220 [Actinomortierella wolfii]|nr:hypothetical protein BGW42_003220 [Actinomortierella wolfii]